MRLDIKKKITGKHVWYAGYIACLLTVALTGLNSALASLVFLGLFVGLVLCGKKIHILLLYPIASVFFGYSNIRAYLPGGIVLETSTVRNFLNLIIVTKLLLFHWDLKIQGKRILIYVLALYCTFITALTANITSGIGFLCTAIIAVNTLELFEDGNEPLMKIYTLAYFAVVMAEVLYGILYDPNTESYGWRALQFSGTMDPNNLSLRCNFALMLCALLEERKEKIKGISLIRIVLAVVVVCTMSFSGICTLAGVFAVTALVDSRMSGVRKIIAGIGIFCVLIAVLINRDPLITYLQSSGNTVLRGLGDRFYGMTSKWNRGDYEGFTSGRTGLWKDWLAQLSQENAAVQIFGSSATYAYHQKILGFASHNLYIDILVKYGWIGMLLFLAKVVQAYFINIKNRRYLMLAFSLMMLVNMFMRSLGLGGAMIFGFLL